MYFIFRNENGGIAIGTFPENVLEHSERIAFAKRIVPAGLAFKIVPADMFPADRSQRDAWSVDDADLTDGIGGEQ